jgi:hypothetical protein
MDHLMAENITKIIKTAKWGKSHQFFSNIRLHFKTAGFEEPTFTLSRLLSNSN